MPKSGPLRKSVRATNARQYNAEAGVVEVIGNAILDASWIIDAVVAIREMIAVLTTILANMIAPSSSAVRPSSMRKICDELHKRPRRRVAAAEASGEMRDFPRRVFSGKDVEGCA